ncbi:hypothetical protein ACLF3G_10255 [Falsiroseomonas sp. HC035]|uniref:hypothetical protein n=1 Tax=Falsiroseomonas sp. HC035 TaxID=3390999 RepID=UPI003D31B937
MRILGASLAVVLAAMPIAALSQPLRSLIVGHDAQVVVPPRGAASLPAARLPALMPSPPVALPAEAAGIGLSAALPVLLPVVAAVLLGAGSPGSGGGSGAPASTR